MNNLLIIALYLQSDNQLIIRQHDTRDKSEKLSFI